MGEDLLYQYFNKNISAQKYSKIIKDF